MASLPFHLSAQLTTLRPLTNPRLQLECATDREIGGVRSARWTVTYSS